MHSLIHAVLIGQSNSGKTTLFNTLTGYRQKVANYAGVTVTYKIAHFQLPSSRTVKITDLPGLYSFNPLRLIRRSLSFQSRP